MAIIKTFPRLQMPGWKASPHLIPQISDPMDDEFDNPAGTLNANWTLTTDTSLGYDINRTMPHHLWVKLDGGASSQFFVQKPITEASTFSYTLHVKFPSKITNTGVFLAISNSDRNDLIRIGVRMTTTTGQYIEIVKRNAGTYGTAVVFQTTRWHDEWFLQLNYEGSDVWRGCYSTDGLGWTSFATQTQAIEIDHVEFYYVNTATTYLSDILIGSDFFRRNWRVQ